MNLNMQKQNKLLLWKYP